MSKLYSITLRTIAAVTLVAFACTQTVLACHPKPSPNSMQKLRRVACEGNLRLEQPSKSPAGHAIARALGSGAQVEAVIRLLRSRRAQDKVNGLKTMRAWLEKGRIPASVSSQADTIVEELCKSLLWKRSSEVRVCAYAAFWNALEHDAFANAIEKQIPRLIRETFIKEYGYYEQDDSRETARHFLQETARIGKFHATLAEQAPALARAIYALRNQKGLLEYHVANFLFCLGKQRSPVLSQALAAQVPVLIDSYLSIADKYAPSYRAILDEIIQIYAIFADKDSYLFEALAGQIPLAAVLLSSRREDLSALGHCLLSRMAGQEKFREKIVAYLPSIITAAHRHGLYNSSLLRILIDNEYYRGALFVLAPKLGIYAEHNYRPGGYSYTSYHFMERNLSVNDLLDNRLFFAILSAQRLSSFKPLLRHPNMAVRQGARQLLRVCSSGRADRNSVNILVNALRSRNSIVCCVAAFALDSINWQPKTEKQKIIYLIAMQDWEALTKIGAPAVPALIKVLGDRHQSAAVVLKNIGNGLKGAARKEFALRILAAFIEYGDIIHSLFFELRQQGLYPDIIYNRAITAFASRRGWVSWSYKSINVISYGLLEEATPEIKEVGLTGQGPLKDFILLNTTLRITGKKDAFGFIPAVLKNKSVSEEIFLLYQPGYAAWQEAKLEGTDNQEVYLFGIDPHGAKVFYLMPWGEVLSCCVSYGGFRGEYKIRQEKAKNNKLLKQYRAEWEKIRCEFRRIYPEILFIRDAKTRINSGVINRISRQTGLSKKMSLELAAAAITDELSGFSAFKLSVIQQYYRKISGHAGALNARIKYVQAILSHGYNVRLLVQEAESIISSKDVSFLITPPAAMVLRLNRGFFEEHIPACDIFELLAYLETVGLVPNADKPVRPLAGKPGFSLGILRALKNGRLLFSEDKQAVRNIEAAAAFSFSASLRLDAPQSRGAEPVSADGVEQVVPAAKGKDIVERLLDVGESIREASDSDGKEPREAAIGDAIGKAQDMAFLQDVGDLFGATALWRSMGNSLLVAVVIDENDDYRATIKMELESHWEFDEVIDAPDAEIANRLLSWFEHTSDAEVHSILVIDNTADPQADLLLDLQVTKKGIVPIAIRDEAGINAAIRGYLARLKSA